MRSRCSPRVRRPRTTCPANASTRSSRSAGFSGSGLGPRGRVLATAGRHRRLHQPELHRTVVGDEQQPAGSGRLAHVLGVVDHAGPTAADRAGSPGRIPGVDVPLLSGVAALAADQHRVPAAARPQGQLEALVRLGQHELVLRDRGPEPVPPHLTGPERLVVDGVEERRRVGAPGAAVVAARDHLGEVLAGPEVAEPQGEHLVAGGVHRVGEQVLVRAHQGHAQVQVAALVGERADVEDDLGRAPGFVAASTHLVGNTRRR